MNKTHSPIGTVRVSSNSLEIDNWKTVLEYVLQACDHIAGMHGSSSVSRVYKAVFKQYVPGTSTYLSALNGQCRWLSYIIQAR